MALIGALLTTAFAVIKTLQYLLIGYVIMGWLLSFRVLNVQNVIVFMIFDFLNKFWAPVLNKIREYVPSFGMLDTSVLIVGLVLIFLESFILGL